LAPGWVETFQDLERPSNQTGGLDGVRAYGVRTRALTP
jgi:hypothetical protein